MSSYFTLRIKTSVRSKAALVLNPEIMVEESFQNESKNTSVI